VLEPGQRYDPETDRAWILSQGGPTKGASKARVTLNGSRSPVIDIQAKRLHRIRLIHIAATLPLRFSILRDTVPVTWRAVAKDGADLPPSQALVRPARQIIGVGETYDFEFSPEEPGDLRVVVKDLAGRTRVAGMVRVHP
jgi:FtsP/CotA-like multicopper oxidase with cupredoxin domain